MRNKHTASFFLMQIFSYSMFSWAKGRFAEWALRAKVSRRLRRWAQSSVNLKPSAERHWRKPLALFQKFSKGENGGRTYLMQIKQIAVAGD